MAARASSRWLIPGTCLIVGYFVGAGGIPWLHAQAPVTAVDAPPFAMAHRLGCNLWVETSPEYRAICWQTYRLAGERLDALMRCNPAPKRPAVVLDLDETVVDNSAFQTYLYNTGQEYSDALWEVYEERYPHDVRLVPGAIEFIRKAEAMGVTVLYISNRMDRLRTSTIAALSNLGINTQGIDARLGLKPTGASSDKTARRAAFTANYDVLLYIGDNLRDFSEIFIAPKLPADAAPTAFDQAIAARLKQVDDCASHWGVDWSVIPNPVYGEWDKILGPRPMERMRPTSMR
jgi:acid phosphatase